MAELETSRELSRAEVAAYLREFADELDRRDDGTTHHDEAHRTDTSNRTTGGTTDTHTADTNTEATRTSRDSPNTATTAENNTADTANASDTTKTTSESADVENSQRHANTNYRKVTFLVGNDSATINPPETVSFDVAVDSDSSLMEAGTRERVDFSIAWDADSVPEDDELRIE